MILFNNRYISNYKIIFILIDTALLVGAVATGYYLRFPWEEYPVILRHLLVRGLFFTFVFQISLYYFELYEFRVISDSAKFGARFIQSVVVSLAVLMISYYMIPNLYLGRGVLLLTVICATFSLFLWRILYRYLIGRKQLKERIIILGTGEFAREIAKAIRDKGDSGFEVIGHIMDEKIKGDKL